MTTKKTRQADIPITFRVSEKDYKTLHKGMKKFGIKSQTEFLIRSLRQAAIIGFDDEQDATENNND